MTQWMALWAALLITGCGAALATPHLRCELDDGEVQQRLDATPVADPYRVQPLAVGDDFRFKAVMVGTADGRVAYVKLYTYALTPRRAALLHQSSHLAPSVPAADSAARDLTGEQRVVSPFIGSELRYRCTLGEEAGP